MEFNYILFIYTVLANAKPLLHMSLRTTKGSHKIILFILQYCSLFSLSVTAYRRDTSLVRERLALIVLFTKERLDREVSLMNSIIRQGSPCEGVRVSGGHLCRRQKHRPSRQARPVTECD